MPTLMLSGRVASASPVPAASGRTLLKSKSSRYRSLIQCLASPSVEGPFEPSERTNSNSTASSSSTVPVSVFLPKRAGMPPPVSAAADRRRPGSHGVQTSGFSGGLSSSAAPHSQLSRTAAVALYEPSMMTSSLSTSEMRFDELVEGFLGPGKEVWRVGKQGPQPSIPADFISNTQMYPNVLLARRVGDLAQAGMFDEALKLIEDISQAPKRTEVLQDIVRKYFMQHAALYRASKAALGFLHALPKRYQDLRLYTMALDVCAASRDLETGFAVVELADRLRFHLDTKMLTTLIKVCASLGRADRAFQVLADMKARQLPMDSHVYGALISACAEAMQRELSVAHERKEQFVLLERAINLVSDAEAAGLTLLAPVWNSLLVCAGRCGQLARAFEVLEMMQDRDIKPNGITYGTLIEACVQNKQQDMALRVYRTALAQGYIKNVIIYTQAISACKVEDADLPTAFNIYTQLQLNGAETDKKLFAALIAVAGKAGQLHVAFELLNDMLADGIPLRSTLCTALIYACQENRDISSARQVYDLCQQHNVYPAISQFNRLMDWYASNCRFGDVVSLLSNMVTLANCKPNLNTYRILLNACQRADQGQLAMQVYALMKANRVPILQERFLNTIYLIIVHCCFNQTRLTWHALGHPPGYPPHKPLVRAAEAQKVLQALDIDCHTMLANSFASMPADGVNWAQQAVAVYRDMVSRGHRPTLDILDMVMGCLRTPLEARPDQLGARGEDQASSSGEGQNWESTYEIRFDRRAFPMLEDAISRGVLPPFNPEEQVTVDLRMLPPTLAEVYTLHLLQVVERRAERDAWGSAVRGKGDAGYFKPIMILVPPFNPDYIIWPSYIKKLSFHYEQTSQEDLEAALAGSKPSGPEEVLSDHAASAAASRREAHQSQREGGGKSQRELGGPMSSSSTREGINGYSTQGSAGPAAEGSSGPVFLPLNYGASLEPEEDEDVLDGPFAHGNLVGEGQKAAQASLRAKNSNPKSPSGARAGRSATTGLAVSATLKRMKCWVNMDHQRGVLLLDSRELARWMSEKQAYTRRIKSEAAALRNSGSGSSSGSVMTSPRAEADAVPGPSVNGQAPQEGPRPTRSQRPERGGGSAELDGPQRHGPLRTSAHGHASSGAPVPGAPGYKDGARPPGAPPALGSSDVTPGAHGMDPFRILPGQSALSTGAQRQRQMIRMGFLSEGEQSAAANHAGAHQGAAEHDANSSHRGQVHRPHSAPGAPGARDPERPSWAGSPSVTGAGSKSHATPKPEAGAPSSSPAHPRHVGEAAPPRADSGSPAAGPSQSAPQGHVPSDAAVRTVSAPSPVEPSAGGTTPSLQSSKGATSTPAADAAGSASSARAGVTIPSPPRSHGPKGRNAALRSTD